MFDCTTSDIKVKTIVLPFISCGSIEMENHWNMVLHSLILGILVYVFMIFVLGQKNEVAERRSILIASFVLIYMIVFGHGLPMKLNKI